MIVLTSERNECDSQSNWQATFAKMLPVIERRLGTAFWRLDLASKEEAIAEGVAHSLFAFIKLYEKGRADVATPSTLAWYSSRQVKCGRPAAGRMNSKDPINRYGQLCNDLKLEWLPGDWIDEIVEDKRASVIDVVAARIDVSAWFATLSQRMKQIARDLAVGCSTSEVAAKYDLTAGRISQLRRKLELSWKSFQQDCIPARVCDY